MKHFPRGAILWWVQFHARRGGDRTAASGAELIPKEEKMKKIIAFILIIAALAALSACAAPAEPAGNVGEGDVPADIPIADVIVPPDSEEILAPVKNEDEIVPDDMDAPVIVADEVAAGWQDAYAPVVAELAENSGEDDLYGSFYLYDLDADGTPELITMTGTCEADALYTFYTAGDTGARNIGTADAGHCLLCGYSAKHTVALHYGHMGVESVDLAEYDGAALAFTSLVAERDIGAGEYLATEPLTGYDLASFANVTWDGDPADGNADVIK